MPGSVPDKVRQKIIAPLQALPNMLEVCGSDSNYLPQVGAHRNKCAAVYCDAHKNHSRQMRHMAAGQAVRLKSCSWYPAGHVCASSSFNYKLGSPAAADVAPVC